MEGAAGVGQDPFEAPGSWGNPLDVRAFLPALPGVAGRTIWLEAPEVLQVILEHRDRHHGLVCTQSFLEMDRGVTLQLLQVHSGRQFPALRGTATQAVLAFRLTPG